MIVLLVLSLTCANIEIWFVWWTRTDLNTYCKIFGSSNQFLWLGLLTQVPPPPPPPDSAEDLSDSSTDSSSDGSSEDQGSSPQSASGKISPLSGIKSNSPKSRQGEITPNQGLSAAKLNSSAALVAENSAAVLPRRPSNLTVANKDSSGGTSPTALKWSWVSPPASSSTSTAEPVPQRPVSPLWFFFGLDYWLETFLTSWVSGSRCQMCDAHFVFL